MSVADLVVRLKMQADELKTGLKSAQDRLKGFGTNLMALGGTLTKSITVPMIAAAAGIGVLMNKYGNLADEILDLSAITGMSTDEIQRWRKMAVNAGVDTDAVADSMRRLNKQLERGNQVSPALARGIDAMNMSVDEFKALAPDERMRAMVQTMVDMSEQDRIAFANQMNMPQLLPIINDVIAAGGDLDAVLGSIEPAFSQEELEMMDRFRRTWDNLKDTLFLLVGQALQPLFEWFDKNREMIEGALAGAVEGLANAVMNLFEWWNNLSPAVQNAIGIIAGILVVAGPVLMIIGAMATGISALIGFFGFLLSPIGLVIAIIVLLVAGIIYLWNTNEDFRNAVIAIWEGIKAAIKGVVDFIKAIWEVHGDNLKQIYQAVWDQIKLTVETAINMIKGVIDLVTAIIQGDWEAAWNAVKGIAETAWNYKMRLTALDKLL
jgi:hypothetical protein